MKAKIKHAIVGGLSTLVLAAIPFVATTANVERAPVTASAATSDIATEQNLALNKWDWEVDEIASGKTTFDEDSMYMDGISSVGGPFATYKTRKLDDFKYSMYANLHLTTPYEMEEESAKDWNYSTFYISFMINYDGSGGIYPVYARPWDGPAYFSICFEKLYLEYKYCPDCGKNGRALKSDGTCPDCGGTDYEVNGRLMDVIRLYRNECFDARGYERITLVEKTWYEGVENDIDKDFDYDGDIDKKDLQEGEIGVNYTDDNYHWFDFEVKNNASNNGIVVNFYYDNVLMFNIEQGNSFYTSIDDGASVNKNLNVNFSGTTGYLGFWTDSSFPDMGSDRSNCYVDVKQLGIAPITNGTVGGYYEKAPKPNLPITELNYTPNGSYPKGEQIEIRLTDLFSYEGDEEIEYTFTDFNSGEVLGTINNGFWLWTPTIGSNVMVEVEAVVQDGTNAKTATNYLSFNLTGEDINATQLQKPVVTLSGNVASWGAVANANGYEYRINGGAAQTATGTSVELSHGQMLEVKAKAKSGDLNYLDSIWSDAVSYVATTLSTPTVNFSGSTAQWNAIAGADAYIYKINGGEEKTTSMTYLEGFSNGDSIVVKAKGNGKTTLDSGWSTPKVYTAETLSTPKVTLNNNVASWNAVANASGYVYKIGENGVEKTADGTSITLTHNQTIYVKAKGNNETTLDSRWSTAVTYVAPTLDTPKVTLSGNVASWEEVLGAEGYVYKINGGAEQAADEANQVTLNINDSIQVKAKGNNETTLDSAWSAAVMYTPTVLKRPTVSLNENMASWSEVAGASGYEYRINGGEAQTAANMSVELTHGQTIEVRAIGDGINYISSSWSIAQTYNEGAWGTPTVELNNNVASWTAIGGAKYVYSINGEEKETTETSVALTHGQTLKVKAVGEGKEDSFWSESVTYVAPTLTAPTVTLEGNVASWETVDGVSYVYKIGINGEEKQADENTVTLKHNEKVYVKAKGDNETCLDSAWVVSSVYVAPTLTAPTVALDGNVASWNAVTGASGYVYKIGANGEEQSTTDTSVTLTHNQTLYVKAKGDNETALDSKWSTAVTYQAAALTAPTVTLNNNVASWNAVAGASGYVYKIGAIGEEKAVTDTSVTLTHNQTIYVKAQGDNETTLDSGWSTAVTYQAAVLTAPTVTLNNNVASWNAVAGANGYVYKIGATGQEQSTTNISVTLKNNQTLYVKAKGNNETALDSVWSAAVTYKVILITPMVTLSGNVASWEAIEGASGYEYSIDGGAVQSTIELSVTLQAGQSIRVRAISESTESNDSKWSTAVTYSATDDASGNASGGIYDNGDNASDGCGSVVGTFGITAMLLAAGVCLVIKRRGENKQ